MSGPFDKTNTGALFPNDKGANPKRPDYSGNLDVNGRQLRISGWWRESRKDGARFLSLRVEPPAASSGKPTQCQRTEAAAPQPASPPAPPALRSGSDPDDAIPF